MKGMLLYMQLQGDCQEKQEDRQEYRRNMLFPATAAGGLVDTGGQPETLLRAAHPAVSCCFVMHFFEMHVTITLLQ